VVAQVLESALYTIHSNPDPVDGAQAKGLRLQLQRLMEEATAAIRHLAVPVAAKPRHWQVQPPVREFLHCLSRTASISQCMIKRGLVKVIQLGWWQRSVNIGQGPFMAWTSAASSSGVRDTGDLLVVSFVSLSSNAANTRQPSCLAQENL
jgi:hypothetical protein